jgi:hypothetical protein
MSGLTHFRKGDSGLTYMDRIQNTLLCGRVLQKGVGYNIICPCAYNTITRKHLPTLITCFLQKSFKAFSFFSMAYEFRRLGKSKIGDEKARRSSESYLDNFGGDCCHLCLLYGTNGNRGMSIEAN